MAPAAIFILKLGRTPLPRMRDSIVLVSTATVNLLTERAVSTDLSLGETVIAIAVAADEGEREEIIRNWSYWECGAPIEVLIDPQRSLVRTVVRYVGSIHEQDAIVTVLIPEIVPRKRRHEVLHNQRGRLLEPSSRPALM